MIRYSDVKLAQDDYAIYWIERIGGMYESTYYDKDMYSDGPEIRTFADLDTAAAWLNGQSKRNELIRLKEQVKRLEKEVNGI